MQGKVQRVAAVALGEVRGGERRRSGARHSDVLGGDCRPWEGERNSRAEDRMEQGARRRSGGRAAAGRLWQGLSPPSSVSCAQSAEPEQLLPSSVCHPPRYCCCGWLRCELGVGSTATAAVLSVLSSPVLCVCVIDSCVCVRAQGADGTRVWVWVWVCVRGGFFCLASLGWPGCVLRAGADV
ncbi:hypothetical protein PVAP13_J354091 [Panicum virgatum]|nr:hypothetical protein PVAP13_J354091 [Panicum virgatum]